jgi:hypothetical protein
MASKNRIKIGIDLERGDTSGVKSLSSEVSKLLKMLNGS